MLIFRLRAEVAKEPFDTIRELVIRWVLNLTKIVVVINAKVLVEV